MTAPPSVHSVTAAATSAHRGVHRRRVATPGRRIAIRLPPPPRPRTGTAGRTGRRSGAEQNGRGARHGFGIGRRGAGGSGRSRAGAAAGPSLVLRRRQLIFRGTVLAPQHVARRRQISARQIARLVTGGGVAGSYQAARWQWPPPVRSANWREGLPLRPKLSAKATTPPATSAPDTSTLRDKRRGDGGRARIAKSGGGLACGPLDAAALACVMAAPASEAAARAAQARVQSAQWSDCACPSAAPPRRTRDPPHSACLALYNLRVRRPPA